ncbi:hypothetical protein RAB80_017354 [Fusarium oxysporum f. sp. vasinfectum]|nr:hypothetical protein RAB80_017354 [Fusarium oxysporum f. sp. vasinfectum]KAK2922505.1 hypothetical protein FoTM2_017358 [Fusarium oxysporum f. sp. vasinfectum]
MAIHKSETLFSSSVDETASEDGCEEVSSVGSFIDDRTIADSQSEASLSELEYVPATPLRAKNEPDLEEIYDRVTREDKLKRKRLQRPGADDDQLDGVKRRLFHGAEPSGNMAMWIHKARESLDRIQDEVVYVTEVMRFIKDEVTEKGTAGEPDSGERLGSPFQADTPLVHLVSSDESEDESDRDEQQRGWTLANDVVKVEPDSSQDPVGPGRRKVRWQSGV